MNKKRAAATRSADLPRFAVDAMIGRRSEQQDHAWVGQVQMVDGKPAVLVLMADGMGGEIGGRLASSLAIEAFRARFDASPGADAKARLRLGVDAANEAIAKAVAADRAMDGMGTTFIGAIVQNGTVTWISVGDSLLLTVHNGAVERLNEDHSLAAVLDAAARRGEISKAEAENNPQRNILRSALTGGRIAMIEVESARLRPRTRLIAATDGLLTLSNATIGALAGKSSDPRAIVPAILDAIRADMPADQDNATVAVVRIGGGAWRRPVPLWAVIVIGLGLIAFATSVAVLATLLARGDEGPEDTRSPIAAEQPGPSSEPAPSDTVSPQAGGRIDQPRDPGIDSRTLDDIPKPVVQSVPQRPQPDPSPPPVRKPVDRPAPTGRADTVPSSTPPPAATPSAPVTPPAGGALTPSGEAPAPAAAPAGSTEQPARSGPRRLLR